MEQEKPNKDAKGKAQVGTTPARQNTDDLFGGGFGRSSEEGAVMALERRAGVKRTPKETASPQRRSRTIPAGFKVLPITYKMVMDAYVKVRRNKGSAGVDGESLADYAVNLRDNLYCLWNRLTSGNYQSMAVRRVEIPKKDGSKRKLGIPTVTDRIAQQVIKSYLEPRLNQLFHVHSYGYRSMMNAHQALKRVRSNCRQYDYVIDMDIKSFFDEVDHDLLMRAVCKHVPEGWIRALIVHWLRAPVQTNDGELEVSQGRGTPQGGVISPLLANLYLHYVFDAWMDKHYGHLEFVRYADDIIVHCRTAAEAEQVLAAIDGRMKQCKLRLHPEKTKIVFCLQSRNRDENYPVVFDFLGHRFQPRSSRKRGGEMFLTYGCAISPTSEQRITEELRQSNFQCWTNTSIEQLAEFYNHRLRGWLNYYGELEKYLVRRIFRRFNYRLLRWAVKKFKRFRKSYRKAAKWLRSLAQKKPGLFAHWQRGFIYTSKQI